MTAYVLGLIPDYGLYIIFIVVSVACLGIPLPSSILVLTSGGLAAAGDLVVWQVLLVTLAAFVVGDQIAFNGARLFGPSLLSRLRGIKRISPLVVKSESMLDKHGLWAVFLSRTIFSPTGPYVGYVSGAVHMNWLSFTSVALVGAALWSTAYCMMGYLFAGQLPQISDLVASMLIVGVATLCAIGFAIWTVMAWRKFDTASL